MKLLEDYKNHVQLLRSFSSAQAMLSWDRETHMPAGAAEDRGQTMSALAGFSHKLFTDKKFVRTVLSLYEKRDALSPEWQRSISQTHRELQKSLKVSQAFVEETSKLVNDSYAAWLDAKRNDNFSVFQPLLEKIVDNRRRYAAMINADQQSYDVLLDEYEEGLTQATLTPLFSTLKAGIGELLPQILERQVPTNNPLHNIEIDRPVMEKFLHQVLEMIGFDFTHGTTGHVEHPFAMSVSPHDIRINTHYERTNHSFTITGMIHELGHGLYEQNITESNIDAFLDQGLSLGIHESQSRFLENIVGRSDEFWTCALPKLQALVPALSASTVRDVTAALNHVEPSLIRTESDEVTYNMHIILRYELEQQLIAGSISVADVPEVWRAAMKHQLHVEPTSNRVGALQDVHWAWGNFGYFPTYTLGNLNAAQLAIKFEAAHPQWRTEIAAGNFTSYFSWFKNQIWQHGSLYTPTELMMRATGEATQTKYFLQYLRRKYLS